MRAYILGREDTFDPQFSHPTFGLYEMTIIWIFKKVQYVS